MVETHQVVLVVNEAWEPVEWTPPDGIKCAKVRVCLDPARRASMNDITIIGLDLAKNVFQIHGAGPDGRVALRKKLSRGRLLEFFAKLPICIVAMEACASAYYWGREISKFDHNVRLIIPACVKPFVKPQKNDAAHAEAIAEAVSRPTMRFCQRQEQGLIHGVQGSRPSASSSSSGIC
ncbi:hypothetical protein EV128_13164 [Rhizobium azibense]|nr:hypothetical protein EV128_13164 [Rhizobium azibense]